MCLRVSIGLILLLCLGAAQRAEAQLCGGASPEMLIVLDRSGSMAQANKWAEAKSAVNTLTSTYAGTVNFGLLMFPFWDSCNVSGPQVATGSNTQAAIASTMSSYLPTGMTPMGAALLQASSYLGSASAAKGKYVLLITDGCETCYGNAYNAIAAMSAKQIKTFVVGFGSGTSNCASTLANMASAGGTGTVYQAANQAQLTAALKNIAKQINCCGNGKLDPGELCDTAIGAGLWGACPVSCDDNDKCTVDWKTGTKCAVQCKHQQQTSPLSGDGCCPAGASSLTDSDCAKVCGNGLLELGELCDPGITVGPGRCPTLADCDDANSCTKDAISGAGCLQQCSNTALTAHKSYLDGCCPAGASSLTDLDCPAACGNGILESGEGCDPGISAGKGKCPTPADCDDKNSCTKDVLAGSACSLKCQNLPAAADPKTKDGCCPKGANAITDADCKPACGNGVLEAGESCDPKIASGKGKCPTLADCDDKDSCTKDAVVGSLCSVKCSHLKLTANPTAKDGCCPKGATSLTDKDCKPVCGNGVLEAGESCDSGITSGAGKCPTLKDCDDKDVCTKDALDGSGCNVSCKHTAYAANTAAKDGCCPKGASSLTDKDCPAGCGNGILEAGETCDPGITTGKGKCPTIKDCDDADPCTKDSLTGGACTLKCHNTLLPVNPSAKDGCCPSGANSTTDPDCLPLCGNGILESGEQCDTGITSGPGKCKTLADCDDGDKCTVDTLVGSGCSSKCSNAANQPDPNKKDGCCPPGHSQTTDADCLPPCGPDKTTGCIDLCKGITCPTGYYCKSGKCHKGNTKAADGGVPRDDAGNAIVPDGALGYDDAGQLIYPEAGAMPGVEAGTVKRTEAGAPLYDGGGGGGGGPGEQGCACQTGGGAGALPGLLLLGLLVVWRRRRA